MKLTAYKRLFEKEFEKGIAPPEYLYSYIDKAENKHRYPIKKEKFYFQSPPITIEETKGQLDVAVSSNKIKTLYLSYLTLDTKFAEVPSGSFVNLDEKRSFYIDLEIATNASVEVIPFIIHYNSEGKKRMTRVVNRYQFIQTTEDEIKLRLTFKIKGEGNFTIKGIAIF